MSYRFINLYELLSIVWTELINEASLLKLVSRPSPSSPAFYYRGVFEFISFGRRLLMEIYTPKFPLLLQLFVIYMHNPC